jgi:hypothetical protein
MTNPPVRRQPWSWLLDLWSDLWTGFPLLAVLRSSHLTDFPHFSDRV